MNRLSDIEIKQIRLFIEDGKSLNQISKKLEKNKTTVYYHFRKIKGRSVRPISVNFDNSELIGEFIGLFAGDGCMDKTKDYKYRVYLYFNISEEEFTKNLIKNVLIKLFGKKPMIFKRGNVIDLCYYSKGIHNLVASYLTWDKSSKKTYSVKLKSEKQPNNFIIGFIRGCLDSDGHLSNKKINFATVSNGLCRNISNLLNKLEIKHSVRLYKEKRVNRKDIYHINVLNSDYNKFLRLIKPRNIRS